MKTFLVVCLLSAVGLGNAEEGTLGATATGSLSGELRGGIERVGPNGRPGVTVSFGGTIRGSIGGRGRGIGSAPASSSSTATSSSRSEPGSSGNYPQPTGVGAGIYGMPYGGWYYPKYSPYDQYGPYAEHGPYPQYGPYGRYAPYGYDEYRRYSSYPRVYGNFRDWNNDYD
ncbi:shematrin-like protein 1 [Dermacentor silvarum]|uniref:shematrin-like protein 1 n=1 Tax=Dermacentor silvarum TaxID=543639 RepID=UPI001898E052|nr:shematrin-like protein 1 [Dermacentor silvarum]